MSTDPTDLRTTDCDGEHWRDDPLEYTPSVRGYQPKKRGTPTAERFAQRLVNVAMGYRFGSQVALRLDRRRARRLRCFYPEQWRGIFK